MSVGSNHATKANQGPIASESELFLRERAEYDAGARENAPGLSHTLLTLLDCHIPGNRRQGGWPQRDPSGYAEAQSFLPRLLGSVGDPADEMYILIGLRRNDCWQGCLKTLDASYELALALLGFLAFSVGAGSFRDVATPDVLGILNAWLKPPAPWKILPGDMEACRHMFIAPWCDLILPADSDGVDMRTMSSESAAWFLVRTDKPPFLPGLCLAQETSLGVVLPELTVHHAT